MSYSKSFELGDGEYEVNTASFSPGSPGSYWDPPDGPEWDGENIVEVTYESGLEDYVTWDTFLLNYALHHHVKLSVAEDMVHQAMCEAAEDFYREWDE